MNLKSISYLQTSYETQVSNIRYNWNEIITSITKHINPIDTIVTVVLINKENKTIKHAICNNKKLLLSTAPTWTGDLLGAVHSEKSVDTR